MFVPSAQTLVGDGGAVTDITDPVCSVKCRREHE